MAIHKFLLLMILFPVKSCPGGLFFGRFQSELPKSPALVGSIIEDLKVNAGHKMDRRYVQKHCFGARSEVA
jgi:hypothetical protein